MDGRCCNTYFRQDQLKTLHDTLRKNSSAIQDAIKKDTGILDAECAIEFALAISEVKELYSSLDPVKDLEEEYRIANGKDASDRREPGGIVYIEPQKRHTSFFSIVAPLSAALAAGNCIKLDITLHTLPSLLRNLLQQALDSDIFAIASSEPSPEFLSKCILVLQEAQPGSPAYMQLISRSDARVIAVVDRTADLALAAESLVTARFSFGGTSPYAPDLILVNEFVKKDFLEHALQHLVRCLTSSAATNGVIAEKPGARFLSMITQKGERMEHILNSIQKKEEWNTKLITKGDGGVVLELQPQSPQATSLSVKISEPIFAITAVTSLDHAIDMATNDASEASLLATYHFASPKHAKYLAQFIKSDVSFINHVPLPILLGPAAPSSHPINLETRYSPSQFTRPVPQFITPPPRQAALGSILRDQTLKRLILELMEDATKEIRVSKRPESIATGFFQQGIFIGLGIYGIPLVTGIGVSVWYAVRAAMERWR
ncbi:hypothetical protein K469DRAFT_622015 [Zopfia rhizophila CBS 207.26]|uniref:ALDH-like protein n=1 Tax=Zopfia rhizophila CBS 207.26 TaxID=1314779 RepID=A0A6A6EM29_9PEZI|nr:hypothetical protein K469DRAFT_622015 [Zopfia rhizophila CBS 207.26]